MGEEKPMDEEKLMNAREVIEFLGLENRITTTALLTKADQKKVPHYRFHGNERNRVQFDPEELREFFKIEKISV